MPSMHKHPRVYAGRQRVVRIACLVVSATILLPVQAAIHTVDSASDHFDNVRGDGICADPLGRCTLRAAVMETNAWPGADTILLPPGIHALTQPGIDDLGWSGDLDVRDDLTVIGAGALLTTIDANALERVIDVHAGGAMRTLTLRGLTLRNGRLDPPVQGSGGAGLRSAAATTVELDDIIVRDHRTENVGTGIAVDVAGCLRGRRVRVLDNRSFSAGTTIYVHGEEATTMACFELEDSEIRGNLGMRAGALHADYANVVLRRSLVADNEAGSGAGAFLFNLGAPALLENVTLSGNRGHVGAIMNDGFSRIDIVNSTITRNGSTKTMQAVAGGILDVHGGFGLVHLRNTILAGNEQGWGFADCNHANSEGGGNILGDAQTCLFAANPSDQLDVDPGLGPLADHGGPTLSHRPGTSAIDRGIAPGCPTTDQRGEPRPLDGDGDGTSTCDVGALEAGARVDAIFANGFDGTGMR
jgi:hypothetical protein